LVLFTAKKVTISDGKDAVVAKYRVNDNPPRGLYQQNLRDMLNVL